MGNASSRRIKAQSIVEASLMMAAAITLLLGIVRTGLWYNNELAERQPAYNESRVRAGSSNIGEWPVYSRRPLTEDWVLKGENFPSHSQGKGGGILGDRRGDTCKNAPEIQELLQEAENKYAQAKALDKEAEALEDEARELRRQANNYNAQVREKYAQAQQKSDEAEDLKKEARELIKQADKLGKECEKKKK